MTATIGLEVDWFKCQDALPLGRYKPAESRAAFSLTTLGRLCMNHGAAEFILPRTMNARVLLTYMIAHAGQDIARERLIDLFWSNFDVDRARGSLKTALWLIRKAVTNVSDEPIECLYASKTIVRWEVPTVSDRQIFLEAANRTDPESWRHAIRLYGGDFLEGHYGDWVDAERARIANMYENVLVKLLGAMPDGRTAELLLERNPYNEGAYRILIEEQLAAGAIHTAALVAARCVAALAEVGVTPSGDIVRCLRTPKVALGSGRSIFDAPSTPAP